MVFYVCTANAQERSEQLARQFITYLSDGRISDATAMFSPQVLEKINETRLTGIWSQIKQQFGEYREIAKVEVTEAGAYQQTISLCQFDNSYLNIRLTLDDQEKVVGIFFAPAAAPTATDYELPRYADPSSYEEVVTMLSTTAGDLKAVYTKPRELDNPPVIVLVHGSGPHDEDATLGPNKIFKDMATGLASNGIATFRYVKRSKAFPNSFGDQMTVDEEVVDDAVNAIVEVKKLSAGPVFLLGHSLGGMMAPKIASKSDGVAGIIFLAGANRPLAEMMIEQVEYILQHDEAANQASYEELRKVALRVKSGDYDDNTPKSELLNIPAAYWKDLAEYDPLKTVKKLKQPMLILQGERDYQVTVEDLERWKSAIRKKGTYRSYPRLNHLFFAGEGQALPSEYQKKGFFDKSVLDDIVSWVNENLGR